MYPGKNYYPAINHRIETNVMANIIIAQSDIKPVLGALKKVTSPGATSFSTSEKNISITVYNF